MAAGGISMRRSTNGKGIAVTQSPRGIPVYETTGLGVAFIETVSGGLPIKFVNAAGSIPNAFSFTDVTNAALSTQYTSNTITVAGLGSGVSVAVTVAGAAYSKNAGAYTSSAGTAQNGDTFSVRHTSSASNSTATNTTLTIGGVSDTFTTTTLADAIAPTLTSPVGTSTGTTTATVGATTNEANGTLYVYVSASATPPSAATLKAGTSAVYASSQAISSTGAKTFSATGLTASTAYYAHLLHRDAAGNDSSIVTSAQFTTSAVAALTISTAPTISGDPVVGQRLYATNGTYSAAPDSITGNWYKAGPAISGETADNYLVQDADVGSVLAWKEAAAKAGYTSSSLNASANTAAVANISLTNAILSFPRTSASGVTPMTFSVGLGSNVYSDYILWARVYSDSGLSTKLQDVSHVLTAADLAGTTDISAQLTAAGLTAIGATEWLQLGIVAHSPAGIAYSFVYPDAISPTDAAPATVWSVANSHASWTLAGNSATSTASGDHMARANHGHSGTGDWSFTLTPSADPAHMLGLSNLTEATDTWVGGGSNSIGFRSTDGQGFNTGGVNLSFTWNNANTITVRLKNGKMYVAKDGTYSTGMNPVAETGGINVSGLGTLYPAVSTNNSGREYVANFTNWPQ